MLRHRWSLSVCLTCLVFTECSAAAEPWKKHVVDAGRHTTNVVAADFTGDGKIDVMANSDGATRLFVGPEWKMQVVDQTKDHDAIHAEVLDVDHDGDPDFIGARYSPGLIFWVETIRGDKAVEPWPVLGQEVTAGGTSRFRTPPCPSQRPSCCYDGDAG